MTIVVDWNGSAVPEALRQCPPGRYVLVPVDSATELTEQEQRGLVEALASARRGDTVSAAEVRARIEARLGR